METHNWIMANTITINIHLKLRLNNKVDFEINRKSTI